MVTPRSRSGRSRRCRRLLSLFYLDWSSPRCADDCASAAATAGRDVAIGGAAAKSSLGLAAAAFVASLSSFQFGYATGILNVPQRIITTDLGLDKDSISWAVVVSIWALGGLLGAQVAAVVADSRGRRPLLALSGLTCGTSGLVAFCAGTASLAAGPESVGGRSALCLLVLSRFISGGGCGMATVAAPLYLGEIATTETRGALGSLAQLSVVVAIVVAQGLAALITHHLGLHWRLVLGLPAFIGAAQLALLPLLPETPRYLLSRGLAQGGEARGEAREALRLLRPRGGQASEAVEAELAALEQELGAGAGGGGRRGVLLLWRDSPSLRLPLLNAAAMMVGQQLSGINAVFYYSTTFFSSAGLDSPVAGTLLASAVNVLAMLASSAMMECAGRRRLLLVGIGGMFLSSVGVTAALIGKARASAHHEDDWSLNWLSVSFVLCFVIAFELGPGPIPWQIGAEIFPEHARAAAMSAAAALNWVCNAAVGLGFPAMSSALGSLVFLPFAAVLLLWLLFTARFTPETRGRSVDEIQVEFRRLAALGSRKPARAEGDGVPLSSIRQPQG